MAKEQNNVVAHMNEEEAINKGGMLVMDLMTPQIIQSQSSNQTSSKKSTLYIYFRMDISFMVELKKSLYTLLSILGDVSMLSISRYFR